MCVGTKTMVPLALSYFEIASLSGRTRAAAIVVTSPSHANHSSRRLTLGRNAALMATFEIIKAGCSWETLALSRAFQTRSRDLWQAQIRPYSKHLLCSVGV